MSPSPRSALPMSPSTMSPLPIREQTRPLRGLVKAKDCKCLPRVLKALKAMIKGGG